MTEQEVECGWSAVRLNVEVLWLVFVLESQTSGGISISWQREREREGRARKLPLLSYSYFSCISVVVIAEGGPPDCGCTGQNHNELLKP